MLREINVLGGTDKAGRPELIRRLDIRRGEVLAIVGPTGSGKTQLISDLEQYLDGDTPTGRSILVDGQLVEGDAKHRISRHLVAEVSQKMNFIIDASVEEFLLMHAEVRGIEDREHMTEAVLTLANQLAGEPVSATDSLTVLSGGQARALMVADVALISDAPVVLIDEIENAGIDRLRALEILAGQRKAVVVVTHDPTLMLMAARRVVMKNGGMYKLHETSWEESVLMERLLAMENETSRLRDYFRSGDSLEDNQHPEEKE